MTSILSALGSGSGIDTDALISSLASAARAGRDARINQLATSNDARISAIGQLTAAVNGFTSGYAALTADASQPVLKLAQGFVAQFNTLRQAVNTATAAAIAGTKAGALNADAAARDLARKLSRLTTDNFAGKSLSDIGIATNRDGTLRLDTARLNAAIASDEPATRELLTGATAAGGAVAGLTSSLHLSDSLTRYNRVSANLLRERARIDDSTTRMIAQLSSQFAAMDKAVAASKAAGAYMTQQVAAWNAQR